MCPCALSSATERSSGSELITASLATGRRAQPSFLVALSWPASCSTTAHLRMTMLMHCLEIVSNKMNSFKKMSNTVAGGFFDITSVKSNEASWSRRSRRDSCMQACCSRVNDPLNRYAGRSIFCPVLVRLYHCPKPLERIKRDWTTIPSFLVDPHRKWYNQMSPKGTSKLTYR